MHPHLVSRCAFAAIVFAGSTATVSHAAWPTDPSVNLPLCTAQNLQSEVGGVTDGQGGAIFVWIDGRDGATLRPYAQHVSAAGDVQWTTDGVPVSSNDVSASVLGVVADGGGGAIVALKQDDGVFLQHLDPGGNASWGPTGVPITTQSAQFWSMISDGAGGTFVAWAQYATDLDIHAQRVDASGTPRWGGGVVVTNAPESQLRPLVVSDGFGGVIVLWQHWGHDDDPHLLAQRLDASGAPQWTINGVTVIDGPGSNYSWDAVADGAGGFIVAFDDTRSVSADLYVQRLDAAGGQQWGPLGLPLCVLPYNQQYPHGISDGAGGAIFAWDRDDRNGQFQEPFAQRIDHDGAPVWPLNGVAVVGDHNAVRVSIDSDGAGGMIAAWADYGAPAPHDIHAQRFDPSGTPQWGASGVVVCNAPNDQWDPFVVSSGSGAAIVGWMDQRADSTGDIYAQRVPFDAPVPTLVQSAVAEVVPGGVRVEWRLSEAAGLDYDIERSSDHGPWQVLGRGAVDGSGLIAFEDRDVQPGTSYGYRLVHERQGIVETLGEVWVEVPSLHALSLRAWPNPITDGRLRLELYVASDAEAALEVFDPAGRRVGRRIVVSRGAGSRRLEAGHLAPGLYVIRLQQGDLSTWTRAVVMR
jgi:hypothetical protein